MPCPYGDPGTMPPAPMGTTPTAAAHGAQSADSDRACPPCHPLRSRRSCRPIGGGRGTACRARRGPRANRVARRL